MAQPDDWKTLQEDAGRDQGPSGMKQPGTWGLFRVVQARTREPSEMAPAKTWEPCREVQARTWRLSRGWFRSGLRSPAGSLGQDPGTLRYVLKAKPRESYGRVAQPED